ncbi:unnamed protein product [Urochloa humidicola]
MASVAALMAAIVASPAVALLLRSAWVALSCYVLTPLRIRRAMARQGVRGPPPRPLVGNLRDVSALVSRATAADMPALTHDIVGRLMPHYVLWSRTYGKLFVYWYGSEPRLCLTDAGMIREFLSSKYAAGGATGKSWLQRQGTRHFIGRGLLMANGARWSHQRHVVAPAFMADKLKGRVGHMVECTKQTIRALREAATAAPPGGGGARRREVDVAAYMTRLAGDIISRTEFDTSYETGKRIFHLLEDLQRLTARSSRHLWIPGSQYFPSKYRREIGRLNAELEAVLTESIGRSREIADEGRTTSAYGRGLLAMLLAEMERKKEDGGDGDSRQRQFSYDLQLVIDECKTFFFAGHDTSALLLTWALMLLSTHPEWQDRARAEVARVCGDAPPSYDDLSKLTVLQMIIHETLRLYPPATLLPRMVFEDIHLGGGGGGGLHLPAGLSVWIPVLAIHHDEAIWGADAHEFRPERFAAGRRPAFLPFAAGPRNCVGQAYALVEAKLVLAMLLQSFRFAISDDYRHAPVNVLTLRPKHGVPVHLRPLRP